MQTQFQAAINQICAEKNLDPAIVREAIENAIGIAYKKDIGNHNLDIKVHLGDDISELRIFEERVAVKKVEDHDKHISLKEASIIRPDIKEEEFVYKPVVLNHDFGRIAAQAAKHVISQKLQEEERKMLFEKFKNREGELLTARVQKVDYGSVLIEIEGVSSLLERSRQIRGEKYFTGQRIKVLLREVELLPTGPQLNITRASESFIVALFEQEIPEIKEGIVYVKKIVREPGVRCKIAVDTHDSSVDPVGTFVGQRGSRINAVMEEVGAERLDIIEYSDNPKKFLASAISPAKLSKVEFLDTQEGQSEPIIKIYVAEDQRAIAIGKNGQNIRLAGKLVGGQIDVVTYDGEPDAEFLETKRAPKAQEKRKIKDTDTIHLLTGLQPTLIEKLEASALTQLKFFESMKPEELAQMEEISEEEANAVIDAFNQYVGGVSRE